MLCFLFIAFPIVTTHRAATVGLITNMRDNLGVRLNQNICFKFRLSQRSPWRFYTVPEQMELLSRMVLAYRQRDEPVGVVFVV